MEIYLSFQLPFVSNSISIITRFQLHFLPLVQHTTPPERIVVLVGDLCWQVLNKGAFAENASNSGAVINNCYHTRRLLDHFVPLSCTHTHTHTDHYAATVADHNYDMVVAFAHTYKHGGPVTFPS